MIVRLLRVRKRELDRLNPRNVVALHNPAREPHLRSVRYRGDHSGDEVISRGVAVPMSEDVTFGRRHGYDAYCSAAFLDDHEQLLPAIWSERRVDMHGR